MKPKTIFIPAFVFIFSFILNFIWENLHYPLYASETLSMNNFFFTTFGSKIGLLLYTSFIDAFWISAVFLLIALLDKDIRWKINWTNGILFSILLIAIAMTMERIGLARGLWVYAASMPIIFGVGLSPLVQLAITGGISLILVKRMVR